MVSSQGDGDVGSRGVSIDWVGGDAKGTKYNQLCHLGYGFKGVKEARRNANLKRRRKR